MVKEKDRRFILQLEGYMANILRIGGYKIRYDIKGGEGEDKLAYAEILDKEDVLVAGCTTPLKDGYKLQLIQLLHYNVFTRGLVAKPISKQQVDMLKGEDEDGDEHTSA